MKMFKIKNRGIIKDKNLITQIKLSRNDKALFDLNWQSTLQFNETVKMTVEWYRNYYQNQEQSMYDFTISQIESYTKAAKLNNITWANND